MYIYRVIEIINRLKNLSISQLELALGVLWLTTDKFVEDDLERNIICDRLGDRMSLIDEYCENKYKIGKDDGMEHIIDSSGSIYETGCHRVYCTSFRRCFLFSRNVFLRTRQQEILPPHLARFRASWSNGTLDSGAFAYN